MELGEINRLDYTIHSCVDLLSGWSGAAAG